MSAGLAGARETAQENRARPGRRVLRPRLFAGQCPPPRPSSRCRARLCRQQIAVFRIKGGSGGSGGAAPPGGGPVIDAERARRPRGAIRPVLSAVTAVARIDYYSTKATRPYRGPDRRLGNNGAPRGFHLYLFSSYIMLKKSPRPVESAPPAPGTNRPTGDLARAHKARSGEIKSP